MQSCTAQVKAVVTEATTPKHDALLPAVNFSNHLLVCSHMVQTTDMFCKTKLKMFIFKNYCSVVNIS